MNLCEQIEHAFRNRSMPKKLINAPGKLFSDDHEDALWFSGRDRREISWRDWEMHSGAIFMFSREAFVYYLPSLLLLAAGTPEAWFYPADTLFGTLDRSPNPDYWDGFIETRLFGLEDEEYEAIKAWILLFSGKSTYGDENTLLRSYETIELLQRETERLRQFSSDLCKQIEHAFRNRPTPDRLIDDATPLPARDDARYFSGKNWREISRRDWEAHPRVLCAFSPEAFVYYLPSILLLTTRNPRERLQVAETLLSLIDRGTEDDFIKRRFLVLDAEECEAIQSWILSLSGRNIFGCRNIFGSEDKFARLYEAVDLLQQEVGQQKRLLHHSEVNK
ncbi:MAG: hypothetical protein LBL72_06710 [Candidatus Accumulibacter sp.]|jgi:hypothetical protein|nr:hypothetical protein [Accumulibacter sp.]